MAFLRGRSVLNHRLPRSQAHPEVVEGAAAFHHEITDASLPQAEPVFANTAARATYEGGREGLTDPSRRRCMNEVQHRVLRFLIALMKDDAHRYPNDILCGLSWSAQRIWHIPPYYVVKHVLTQ